MAEPEPKEPRLKFDPTINAGHVLTFVAMVVGLITSYSLLDKRIGVLEERSNTAILLATDRQTEQKESLREIKSDIRELTRSVNGMSQSMANGGKKQ